MKNSQSMKTKKESQSGQRINMNHMAINHFVDVSIPNNIISLSIQENYITDFIGLDSCQLLESLMLDRNPIISFHGFPHTPNLVNLSMIDTPISKLPNFRALAVIVAGQQLKTLNGIEVSSNDRAAALAYGQPEIISQLVVRGWIPKRPVSLPKQKFRKNDTSELNVNCRILKLIQKQSEDPISVKITRVLRAQGYNITQIRDFLHEFFSPHSAQAKQNKSQKEDSAIEAQIKKQQQIIDVLAAQLQALRSGNQTFNDYDQMVRSYGANLLKNAELLRKEEADPQNDNMNNESQEAKKKNKPDYQTLRHAIVDFLQVEESVSDDELIRYLDSINVVDDNQILFNEILSEPEEEEEEEEEAHDEEEEAFLNESQDQNEENKADNSEDVDKPEVNDEKENIEQQNEEDIQNIENQDEEEEIYINDDKQDDDNIIKGLPDGEQDDLFEKMNKIIEEEDELEQELEEEESAADDIGTADNEEQ